MSFSPRLQAMLEDMKIQCCASGEAVSTVLEGAEISSHVEVANAWDSAIEFVEEFYEEVV